MIKPLRTKVVVKPIVRTLSEVLKAHFKTILVISHINLIKEAADTIIEVTSDGQNSKIEMFSKDDAKSNN